MDELKNIWSAGGVIIFEEKIIICHRKKENLFCLPKGTPENDESPEQTALREVYEETGLLPKIINQIGEIRYQFQKQSSTKKYKNKDSGPGTPLKSEISMRASQWRRKY